MFKSLRRESEGKHVQQSHKVYLKIRALQRFDQMARDSDLLDQNKIDPDNQTAKNKRDKMAKMQDTYLEGIKCLFAEVRSKPTELGRFLMHLPYINQEIEQQDEQDVDMENDEEGEGQTADCDDHSSSSSSDDELELPLIDLPFAV
ncbi:hypothetical protein MJO29_008788 [Puccinia striiformis f. sp. tritici]|nr:hypothetical protein Pst134EB_016166 [Puccinia striiformis f. sp. tritici]KAI7953157.1 hypothetical protein MJO29_008788 [Puccinia striiformis f. sp. tritici]